MQYIVRSDYALLHAGETGEQCSSDGTRIFLKFDNGDKCGYFPTELESYNGGLPPEEQSIMDNLVSAWNKFIKLEKQHPCDINEFGDAIHRLQGLLAMRPLRRQYPDYWKSYKE